MLTDAATWTPEAVSSQTRTFNERLRAAIEALPDHWAYPPAVTRAARSKGRGPFPLEPADPDARTLIVPGSGNEPEVAVRVIAPANPRGTYLHIHGGGWTLGSADGQDTQLRRIADATGLACASVEYRLAPEHPFPAGPDDCLRAARALVSDELDLPTERLVIGGESAGAHLAVLTLLALRDRDGLTPFQGAQLMAGCYDLGQTASARHFDQGRLVLTTRDMRLFASCFLSGSSDRRALDTRHPAVSPLYADLAGLPPALFTVGTHDALLDDTLQMATRWHAAGLGAELEVAPGGCHMYHLFDELDIAVRANARIHAFLADI